MLIIRDTQLAHFAAHRRRQFILTMCTSLRELFNAELWAVDPDTLFGNVEAALERAASYGLSSERDCFRYLNLAVACGWDFDRQPKRAWMRNMLTDPQVSAPGDRLQRLVDEYFHRCDIEENDRWLRAQYEGRNDKGSADGDGAAPDSLLASKE